MSYPHSPIPLFPYFRSPNTCLRFSFFPFPHPFNSPLYNSSHSFIDSFITSLSYSTTLPHTVIPSFLYLPFFHSFLCPRSFLNFLISSFPSVFHFSPTLFPHSEIPRGVFPLLPWIHRAIHSSNTPIFDSSITQILPFQHFPIPVSLHSIVSTYTISLFPSSSYFLPNLIIRCGLILI